LTLKPINDKNNLEFLHIIVIMRSKISTTFAALFCLIAASISTTGFLLIAYHNSNQQAYAQLIDGDVYELLSGGNSKNDNYENNNKNSIITVSTEEEEEEEDDEQGEAGNGAANEEICARYLETCPTPPSTDDTAKKIEEEIGKKYLGQDGGSNIAEPVTPNVTTTPNNTFGSSSIVSGTPVDNSINTTQIQQANFQMYHSPNLGIRMHYPTDWQIQGDINSDFSAARAGAGGINTTNATTVAFFSPLKDSGLRIEVGKMQQQQQQLQQQILNSQNSSQSLLPNTVSNFIDRFSKQYADFQIISSNATAAVYDSSGNTIPAYKVVFSYTSSSLSSLPSQSSASFTGEQQFPPLGKKLFGLLLFTGSQDKSYLIEAYSEISEMEDAQKRKYSNNLITPQQMMDSLEIIK